MSTLMALFIASACPDASLCDVRMDRAGTFARTQESQTAEPGSKSRIVLQKEGAPGAGPDQPYNVREAGATDLQDFVGGKQVVFVEPWDFFFIFFLVAMVVVIIIVI